MTDLYPEHDPNAEVALPGPPELLAVPADTSYEIELDERPQAPAAPVYADISPPEGARLPIIPEHLQSLEGIKAAGQAAHWAAGAPRRLPRHPQPEVSAARPVLGRGRRAADHRPPDLLVAAPRGALAAVAGRGGR